LSKKANYRSKSRDPAKRREKRRRQRESGHGGVKKQRTPKSLLHGSGKRDGEGKKGAVKLADLRRRGKAVA
jgi:hypothetical protein